MALSGLKLAGILLPLALSARIPGVPTTLGEDGYFEVYFMSVIQFHFIRIGFWRFVLYCTFIWFLLPGHFP